MYWAQTCYFNTLWLNDFTVKSAEIKFENFLVFVVCVVLNVVEDQTCKSTKNIFEIIILILLTLFALTIILFLRSRKTEFYTRWALYRKATISSYTLVNSTNVRKIKITVISVLFNVWLPKTHLTLLNTTGRFLL